MTEAVARQRIEAVWRERANRLSERPVFVGAGQGAVQVVVLGIGTERYGIDIPDVAEILPQVRITPLPGAPAAFAGVINVHGEIRPVADLRRLLGMDAVRKGDPSRVIVLRCNGREMGLQIDSVEQIRRIDPVELESGGDAGAAGPLTSQYVKTSTRDLLMLLNTEALFAQLDTGVTT
jgi:chemotaxis signal transduction protein